MVIDSWADIWDALAAPYEGEAPAKVQTRTPRRRTISEAITDLAETILWFFTPRGRARKKAKTAKPPQPPIDWQMVPVLIDALDRWWRKSGRGWKLTEGLRAMGANDEDIHGELRMRLICRQGMASRFTPSRTTASMRDPHEAYVGMVSRGVLKNLWRHLQRRDEGPTMAWDADRDTTFDIWVDQDETPVETRRAPPPMIILRRR